MQRVIGPARQCGESSGETAGDVLSRANGDFISLYTAQQFLVEFQISSKGKSRYFYWVLIHSFVAGKIHIDVERCKGCGLCVQVCRTGSIQISKQSNKKGYFPAEPSGGPCSGCAMCAIVCPDAVIEVVRNASNTIESVPAKGSKGEQSLAKERK